MTISTCYDKRQRKAIWSQRQRILWIKLKPAWESVTKVSIKVIQREFLRKAEVKILGRSIEIRATYIRSIVEAESHQKFLFPRCSFKCIPILTLICRPSIVLFIRLRLSFFSASNCSKIKFELQLPTMHRKEKIVWFMNGCRKSNTILSKKNRE